MYIKNVRVRKKLRLILFATIAMCGTIVVMHGGNAGSVLEKMRKDAKPPPNQATADHQLSMGNWRQLSSKQSSSLSKLGRVLFLDEDPPAPRENSFVILVWKYGSTTHNRHIKHYSAANVDPFERCAVKNCNVTYEDAALSRANMVIIHLHRTTDVTDVPPERRADQIWAFSTDESAYHTFLDSKHDFPAYSGMFNWSMHYRMDADIPVPYGRTTARRVSVANSFDFAAWLSNRTHTAPVAVMGSNCGSNNHRWEYVAQLQKHIQVDFYGRCGTMKCAGHFDRDCPLLSRYRFYLAFENSNCDEYITEKLWWNAYAKDAIPIVMGGSPSRRNYQQLLPPRSYINVGEFAAPRDLAAYLHRLLASPDELESYFAWRNYFEVHNEHGYFQTPSFHYCRACEALNYNDLAPKTYTDLDAHWSVRNHCSPPWDDDQPVQIL